jgi:rubrerythrin
VSFGHAAITSSGLPVWSTSSCVLNTQRASLGSTSENGKPTGAGPFGGAGMMSESFRVGNCAAYAPPGDASSKRGQFVAEKDFATVAIELAAIEHLDVPAMELLYRLECSGEDFYNLLADRIDDERAADLFRRNGREELGHARRIQRAISLKLGRDYEPDAAALTRFEVTLPDPIGPELLPAIVQGEISGDAGYQKWADNEPDPEVARLLRLNGREETRHGERVTQAIAILQGS